MTEKIDFVVLWVDGEDPEWQREKARFEPEYETSASSINRYRDWDLMRYWFRGVEKYAPWVNRIFFVTSGQIPEWLKAERHRRRQCRQLRGYGTGGHREPGPRGRGH